MNKKFITVIRVLAAILALALVLGCSESEQEKARKAEEARKAREAAEELAQEQAMEKKKMSLSGHLKDGEHLVFGFLTKKGKTLTVAEGKVENDMHATYIVYRYGTKDKVELSFPAEGEMFSPEEFICSIYMRPGGPENAGLDVKSLKFNIKGYKYEVYDEYSAESSKGRSIGVRVTDMKKKKVIADIEGDISTMYGSMVDLKKTAIWCGE